MTTIQLINHFNGLQKEIGFLINYDPTGVEAKRKYRQIQNTK
jgi:hypothetical protein